MILNIQVVFSCRVCTALGSWQGVLQSITAALYHPRAEREPGPAIGGTGASSRPAFLAPSVEIGAFITNPCVFWMWNLPPMSPAGPFPQSPRPHRAHSASNAAFICRLAEARCPPHSDSLISVNPVPGQNKLCLPEHIWEGWQGWEAAWQQWAKGPHGLISAWAPPFTRQSRW